MDDVNLRRLWQQSLGPGVQLEGLATEVTYRPLSWLDTELPESGLEVRNAYENFSAGQPIGRGGMGVVYRGHQRSLDREVALKKLRRSDVDSDLGTRFARRHFIAEALVNGQLQHPNIVPVYEVGATPDGELFLAMKLVAGRTWQKLLEEQPGALDLHLPILQQVMHAVAYAHSREILHNDLKPANVMLGEFGEVQLMDWGLAVSFGDEQPGSQVRHRSAITSPCGTPSYLAPELADGRGDSVGPWTDVYLLGGTLFEILSGQPPHPGAAFMEVVARASRGTVPELDPGLPAELRAICQRALSPEPEARYPDVRSMQAELAAYLSHRESLRVSDQAEQQLQECVRQARAELAEEPARNGLYEAFAEAVAGFAQARGLWPGNPAAQRGEREARQAYAWTALRLGDHGLAEALAARLPHAHEEARSLRGALTEARARRRASQRAKRRLSLALGLSVLIIVAGLLTGLLVLGNMHSEISQQSRELARSADSLAVKNHQLLVRDRIIAQELERVREQKEYADRRGRLVQELLNTLATEVQQKLLRQLGSQSAHRLAREILEVAREGWQELRATDVAESEVSWGAAFSELQVGRFKLQLEGDLVGARRDLERAVVMFEQLAAEAPGEIEPQLELCFALRTLGQCLQRQGHLSQAAEVFTRCLWLAEELSEADADAEELRRNLQLSLASRGELHLLQGLGESARQLFERALQLARDTQATDPSPSNLRDLGVYLERAGDGLRAAGAWDAAMEHYQESLVLRRQLWAEQPASAMLREDLGASLERVGELELYRGQVLSARALFEERLQLERGLVAEDPASVPALRGLALALGDLGDAALAEGAPIEAAETWAESLELFRDLAQRDPSSAQARRDLARALDRAGRLAEQTLELDSAAAYYREALDLTRQLSELDSSSARARRDLSVSLEKSGDVEMRRRRFEPARQAYSESLELREGLAELDPGPGSLRDLSVAFFKLGSVSHARGNFRAALPFLERAVELHRELARLQTEAEAELRTLEAVLEETRRLAGE